MVLHHRPDGTANNEERRPGTRRDAAQKSTTTRTPTTIHRPGDGTVVRRCRDHRRVARGFVYLIQAVDGGPIKIGFAADPAARLRELQVGHPERLRVLVTLADDGGLERQLHRRFARLRLRGELFIRELADELELIRTIHARPAWAARP